MSIELKNVTYTYSPGTAYEIHALKDINLSIPDGQFIGIIGHTGSGKSTLIQHFNALIRPTSGTITYNGEDIWGEKYDRRALRSEVGLVFQYPEHQLFENDVLSDVCFGPMNQGLSREEAEVEAKKALQHVGFKEKNFSKSPFELSGGQKKRVAIAGVLAMNPKILILDEPTAGLDPKGRDDILDQIAELHKVRGITIILVSHSMEDIAKYAERLIVVNDGEIAYDDAPKAVFAHYRELEAMGLAAPQITYIMHALKEKGLDVGFAYDGDADRCLAVDENGNVVDGDLILYICGKYMKEQGLLRNNKIVTTVMSNLGLYKALDREEIGYEKTAVGDKYVYENMSKTGNCLGGEQSGHIIFSKYATTGDGILTSLKIMEVMLEKKETLGKLASEVTILPQLLKNVRVADKAAALNDPDVQAAGKAVDEALGNGGRLLLRQSGTEPLIRVMVEAETPEICEKYVDQVIDVLKKKGHVTES